MTRGTDGEGVAAAAEARDVVVLLDSLIALGGAETLAIEHVIGLDPDRWRRTLCLTHDQSEVRRMPAQATVFERLRESGVEVLELGRKSRFSIRPWLRLISFLRRRRVAVLHAHKFGSNAWGVLCGRIARVPAVISHEHMWSYADSSPARRFVDRRWVGPGSDALIAVSREGRRQMIEVVGVDPEDVIYVPNGVPAFPPPNRPEARSRLELAEETTAVGTVALLRPEKRLGDLVEAAGILAPDFPELKVVIVGDGPERDSLEARIAELGLEGVVELAGYRDDVSLVLGGFDIAVCCSQFEGGPLSVMEYMEARLPIVATNVGGLPEMLDDGRCGVLVDVADPPALAAGIRRLLVGGALRAELGSAAFERKRSTYSLDTWIERMEQIYDKTLADRRRLAGAA